MSWISFRRSDKWATSLLRRNRNSNKSTSMLQATSSHIASIAGTKTVDLTSVSGRIGSKRYMELLNYKLRQFGFLLLLFGRWPTFYRLKLFTETCRDFKRLCFVSEMGSLNLILILSRSASKTTWDLYTKIVLLSFTVKFNPRERGIMEAQIRSFSFQFCELVWIKHL